MKRFTIKFLAAAALFFIPAIVFRFHVADNTSGDIGELGMIPFGKEKERLGVSWYQRDMGPEAQVVDIYNPDELCRYSTVTIGDSFSQFGKNGYQQSLSNRLGSTVANFKCYPSYNVLNNYLILLNNGFFTDQQTVILECVERSLIGRFSRIHSLESDRPLPERKTSVSSDEEFPSPTEEESKKPFLNSFFSWIRLSVGYRNPIRQFPLTKACFTHDRFAQTLFVYNSEKARDGDLLWEGIRKETYEKAADNMKRLIDYSEQKGIHLIILIACDKYDAYEPWIKDAHKINPTLDHVPDDRRIYVSRGCLRDAIGQGIQDVYKVNDTHWSVVGADIVGNSLYDWMMTR